MHISCDLDRRIGKLPPDFWCDSIMILYFYQRINLFTLLRSEICFVTLHQRQQSLMPHHGHFLWKDVLIIILLVFSFVSGHTDFAEIVNQLVQNHCR
jgi:hypothetical protein